jgi:signal peptidase
MTTGQSIEVTGPRNRINLAQAAMILVRLLLRGIIVCAIVTAVAIFACAVVPSLFGYRTMIVTSGSMEPTVSVGDAAMVKPVDGSAVEIGDVITFRSAGGTGMTTHRAIATKEIGGKIYYQTKGDANETPDPDLVAADAVYGKVPLSISKAGYLLSYVATPWGRILSVGIPMLFLVAHEFRGLFGVRRPTAVESEAPQAEPVVEGAQQPSPNIRQRIKTSASNTWKSVRQSIRAAVATRKKLPASEEVPSQSQAPYPAGTELPPPQDQPDTPDAKRPRARYILDEGQLVRIAASFTDQGWLHNHSAAIDWGDGTIGEAEMDEDEGKGSVTGEHTYGRSGTYQITVEVTDDTGSVGTDTILVVVRNVAPVVKIEGLQVRGKRQG